MRGIPDGDEGRRRAPARGLAVSRPTVFVANGRDAKRRPRLPQPRPRPRHLVRRSCPRSFHNRTDATMSAHHVVVVGAGFGGLETVHRLASAPVQITIVDRRNHHLFQPLLYLAATASLAPSEIAWPIRHLFRRRSDVTTLLASVETLDKQARELRLGDGSTVRYDTLVLATGARHAYFGHDAWEPFAPGLKTREDATPR